MEEEFDLKKYIKVLLPKWKFLLVLTIIGAVLGIIIGLSTPKAYTSKAVMAPELVTRASSGGLVSLANLPGLNMNSVAVTDAMHPDLYPIILSSTSFIADLFDMPVEFVWKGEKVTTDLYDYILNYTKTPWYSKVLTAPMKGLGKLISLFTSKKAEERKGHEEMDMINFTKEQTLVIKGLKNAIQAVVEKKTYILQVSVSLQNPKIAAQLSNYIIEKLRGFVVDYRTQKARETVEYYQKLFEESKADYLESERKYARYVDSHQGIILKSVQIEQQHLMNETELKYQLYNSTAQSLMAAKAKLEQEAPVLVVIQPGVTPRKGTPSTSKMMIEFAFLAFIAGVCLVLWKNRGQLWMKPAENTES